MGIDWTEQLVEQLDFHWRGQLRPRLDGLGDEEYLWMPVEGCWTVHPAGGGYVAGRIDFAFPPPDPAPVTTIAWRLAHLIIGCFGMRSAAHFGGPAMGYTDFPYAATAQEALRQLDEAYATWAAGVRGLDEAELARPVGPAEGPYAESPMAVLVLHINREVIHHGAEIALLRDLYARR